MNGLLYALSAAMANSSIGLISHDGFATMGFYQIAVFKNLIAFTMLSVICYFNINCRKQIYELYNKKAQLAFLSFWGIFVLCFFQIKAFSIAPLSLVSFMFYAAGILTILLGYFILNEDITIKKIFGLLFVVFGTSLIIKQLTGFDNTTGIMYSIFSGIGYSIFMVFCRKFSITPNIGFLWWFIGFGSLFLLAPAMAFKIELSLPKSGLLDLLLLAIIPTIGGFYFTSKALSHTDASKVQIIEMSEPFFTTLGAFILFEQTIGIYQIFGGICILIGIFQTR